MFSGLGNNVIRECWQESRLKHSQEEGLRNTWSILHSFSCALAGSLLKTTVKWANNLTSLEVFTGGHYLDSGST